MLSNFEQACFCGSDKILQQCCLPFINGEQFPENPEQLMRSRYSAYILKKGDYILKSWHASTRPKSLNLSEDTTQWKGLRIISSTDTHVHFVAYFTQDTLNKEKVYALTENSRFIKEGHWFYLDGEDVNTVQLTKNMLCPCQSGKKYKRCCALKII